MVNEISQSNRVYIIAEAGVNHNGDVSLAKELIDIASDAGADAIKFQTFIATEVISIHANQADYQVKNTGLQESQLAMVKKLELPLDDFKALYLYAKNKGITFLSTAFDPVSLKFLVKDCNIPLIKIPSGEITNAPLLFACARYNMPIVLSTGMANLDEIERALAVLSYGWVHESEPESLQECIDFYQTEDGIRALYKNITILQCITEYPAPYKDTNLKAMQAIADKFHCPIGLSDHSLGLHIPVAAVAMGATIIEKHFTINQNLPGPDHKASLSPDELKTMIHYIRDVEAAFGDGHKQARDSEKKNMTIARRSIVAADNLKKDEVYAMSNITCKRPGSGVSAMLYWDYLGKECNNEYKVDELIT